MNYFAHGIRFVDRPYFVAGTAVPDWLSVADRRVRMREKLVAPYAVESGSPEAEVACGVLQHLQDDHWFHESRAFAETIAHMGQYFRELLGPDDGFRPGFLGHIVTEMLLDTVLIDRRPQLLDQYYTALEQIDPHLVEASVNRMARHTTDRLAVLIPLFLDTRFLEDYRDAKGLLRRLNQVMQRIKLNQLPPETTSVLERGRALVDARAAALLPDPDYFD